MQPKQCTARANLAKLLVDGGKIEAGLSKLRRALRCKPGPRVYADLAALELRRGQAAQAEHSARAGLRYAPEQRDLRYLLGRALQRQGRLDLAQTAYEEVLAQHPRDQRARLQLVGLLATRCRLGPARRLAAELCAEGRLRASRLRAMAQLLARATARCAGP